MRLSRGPDAAPSRNLASRALPALCLCLTVFAASVRLAPAAPAVPGRP